jgi:hypothetical protein
MNPRQKNDCAVLVVKAETQYALAKEECAEQERNAKNACVKEVKAMKVAARAALAK